MALRRIWAPKGQRHPPQRLQRDDSPGGGAGTPAQRARRTSRPASGLQGLRRATDGPSRCRPARQRHAVPFRWGLCSTPALEDLGFLTAVEAVRGLIHGPCPAEKRPRASRTLCTVPQVGAEGPPQPDERGCHTASRFERRRREGGNGGVEGGEPGALRKRGG